MMNWLIHVHFLAVSSSIPAARSSSQSTARMETVPKCPDPYPASKQVARIGNSVVPIMAGKLVGANCGYLKVGERQPIIQVKDFKSEASGQMRFA